MLFRQRYSTSKWSLAPLVFMFTIVVPITSQADEVIVDDLIVKGSECVGLDCDLDEEFEFSTLKLKENNLRIFLNDTSTTASFPSNDWEIIANESANGGVSFLGFADRLSGWPTVSGGGLCDSGDKSGEQCTSNVDCAGVCNGGTLNGQACYIGDTNCATNGGSCDGAGSCAAEGNVVLLMEAGAPANSLKIDSAGFVGLGTDAPAAELDVEGDAIVRGNLTVTGTIGGGTGTDQLCPTKQYVIGIAADGTIICAEKNK